MRARAAAVAFLVSAVAVCDSAGSIKQSFPSTYMQIAIAHATYTATTDVVCGGFFRRVWDVDLAELLSGDELRVTDAYLPDGVDAALMGDQILIDVGTLAQASPRYLARLLVHEAAHYVDRSTKYGPRIMGGADAGEWASMACFGPPQYGQRRAH